MHCAFCMCVQPPVIPSLQLKVEDFPSEEKEKQLRQVPN